MPLEVNEKPKTVEKKYTRLEVLANHLLMYAPPFEVQATEKVFSANIRFWELCMKALELMDKRREVVV